MKKLFTEKELLKRKRTIEDKKLELGKLSREAGEAQADGGLHENSLAEEARRRAEFAAAELSDMEAEIDDIEMRVPLEQSEIVAIGSTVLININGTERELTIGCYGESDIENNLIAYNSPMIFHIGDLKKGEKKTYQIGEVETTVVILDIMPPSHRYDKL